MKRQLRTWVLAGITLATFAGLSLGVDGFFDRYNFEDLARHNAEIGILACGMTLIIMTGGIDLSVGSLLALCSMVLGMVGVRHGLTSGLISAGLVGVLGGTLNAALILWWRIPPLVVTLATMAFFRGLTMVISEARPVSHFPAGFEVIGQGYLSGLPVQALVWCGVVAATWTIAAQTTAGRSIVALGESPRAFVFAALPRRRLVIGLYAGMGFLVALSAWITTSRFATAKADTGEALELKVITAVVLGGTLITGGRGSVVGSFLAVLLLGMIRNGLMIGGVSTVVQDILTGCILMATAMINARVGSGRSAGRLVRPEPESITREQAP